MNRSCASRTQRTAAAFRAGIALAAVAMLGAGADVAGAYTTANGFVARDYATAFPSSATAHFGPIGIAFDQSDNLYVGDIVDGNIYRFQPGGGIASGYTRLTDAPIAGAISGLAFTPSGDLYVARYRAGDVVQVDPGTGRIIRSIASVPCATGLAADPLSGDLFVSQNECGTTIFRISGFAHGAGTASRYTTAPGVDGIAFDRSGTLYAVSGSAVLRIEGTRSAAAGAATSIASVPHADGLAFGATTSDSPPFLVANRTDGLVTRVDFGGGAPTQSDIFSGGTRGDFVAVDSLGCLYITQTDRVVRVSGDGVGCAFQPTTATPGATGVGGSGTSSPGVTVSVVSSQNAPSPAGGSRPSCTPISSLRFRIAQHGRVRLRSAAVYINGRKVKTVRGGAVTAPIVLSRLPRSSFTLTVVAMTTRGRRLTTRKSFGQCTKPRPVACRRLSRLVLSVPQSRGTRIVRVDAYLNGRRVKSLRGRRIMHVVLASPPPHRFIVRLVTWSASGGRSTVSRRFTGCRR